MSSQVVRTSTDQEHPLLQVQELKKYIEVPGRIGRTKNIVRAVDGVSLSVGRASSFGIVGETGSGKTTLARLITRLTEPTSGDMLYDGKSITNLRGKNLGDYHRKVQMVFQNPYGSLDPRQRVNDSLHEPFFVN